jgi:GDP-L-fucose synthase
MMDSKLKKIVLVTGGTGLVGSAIKDYVDMNPNLQQWADWIFMGSIEYDFRSADETAACFIKYHPTHVIHLAARVGGLFANMKNKVEFWRDNIYINDNVMEQCRLHHVEKLVSFLSTCIFPDQTSYPINETMVHLGPPHSSNEAYAYAKRMIDVLNHCYREQYGCNFTSVIPTNIFGPYDNYSLESGHVIPNLIHKCYLALKNNTPLIVQGSGKPLRQFIYSRDLARLVVWTLRQYGDTEPLVLSVDECDEISISDIAHLIAKTMGLPASSIVFDHNSADGQFRKTASNGKLRQLLPDFQFTPIEEAIKLSCQWFAEHYETVRK